MRRILVWAFRVLAILVVLLAAAALWKRDDITRLLAVNSLFAEDRIVANFSAMDDLFFHTTLPRGDAAPSPLPPGPPWDLPPDVAEWITDRSVTALVILKDGALVHESYHLGTGADDRRISWSVAKSFLSALAGILVAEGAIPSLDVPVTEAAPALAGSAYDGATLRHVLQMSSGVRFNEDYLDFNSDINRMGRVLALGGSMDGFAAGLTERDAAPGDRWHYVSIDTHVVGMVLAGLTGRSVADLITDHIVAPMGFEADPIYLTDGYGVPFVLGGLNLTTRDYARFGQMLAQGGQWQGRQIVPEDWITASTTPSAPTAPGAIGYGFQWWVPQGWPEGRFLAQGIYGQFILIDRARNVVVAVNSAERGFAEPGVEAANHAMLARIADAL
jgi:CubicO group peptidase (beta-lactamase class C family)